MVRWSTSALFQSLMTVWFGVIVDNQMLGEAFTPSLGVALVLIAFGIYLVNRPAARL